MEVLFAHASGLDWDELLIVFGGLALLTLVLAARLRPTAPATEQTQPDVEQHPAQRAKRRHR